MDKQKTNNTESKELGISLDKKTVIAILSALVVIMVLVGVLTQVLPRGEYDVIEKDGYEQIVNGTYTELNDYKMPVWKIFLAPILCFTSSYAGTGILIIAMVVLIGGAFLILDKCGVMKFMMASLIKKFSNRKYVLMAIIIFCCMALSSVAGVLEESVTLVPIAVAVSLALGWDSLVGLGLSLVSIAWGFTAATFNPFNVATVQKLAGLEVFSGLSLRLLVFAGVYLILFAFLFVYARRIEKNPQKSLVYESDKALREKYKIEDVDAVLSNEETKKGAKAFLICMFIDVLAIIADFVMDLGGALSLPAMAILFTVGGILAGYFTGLRGRALVKSFLTGAKTIAPVIPVVIFVVAISYILAEAKIMHTILFNVYNLLQGLSPYVAIILLFLLIAFLEFFIGSGTAKAFLIMPLIAPLSDLVGITRQSIVTTFC
ncbi:MAG: YfcC family protein, partial [Clostridia bacterium]|nr:YfcC family protein [Clostridia bacterium]